MDRSPPHAWMPKKCKTSSQSWWQKRYRSLEKKRFHFDRSHFFSRHAWTFQRQTETTRWWVVSSKLSNFHIYDKWARKTWGLRKTWSCRQMCKSGIIYTVGDIFILYMWSGFEFSRGLWSHLEETPAYSLLYRHCLSRGILPTLYRVNTKLWRG